MSSRGLHEDAQFPQFPHSAGEKMIGFFRWCTISYGALPEGGRTSYCVKTDDDAYVHTVGRLTH